VPRAGAYFRSSQAPRYGGCRWSVLCEWRLPMYCARELQRSDRLNAALWSQPPTRPLGSSKPWRSAWNRARVWGVRTFFMLGEPSVWGLGSYPARLAGTHVAKRLEVCCSFLATAMRVTRRLWNPLQNLGRILRAWSKKVIGYACV